MRKLENSYTAIVSEANLWRAWRLFRRGKRFRDDVQRFERNLERNLLELRDELKSETFHHGGYRSFIVHDPKRRRINAPGVRDQLVHQAIWNVVFPHCDRRFSPAVYSCRPGRGTHSAVMALRRVSRRLAKEGTVSVLYLDIEKFFDSVRHDTLKRALRACVGCPATLRLLDLVIDSYDSGLRRDDDAPSVRRGIPLGNLTSQLLCNVALMSFDEELRMLGFLHRYIRYADDCFILGTDYGELVRLADWCVSFLGTLGFSCRMRITKFAGFEALGKRFFTDGVVIRRNTRRRALVKLKYRLAAYAQGLLSDARLNAAVQSCVGLSALFSDPRWTKELRAVILGKTYAGD